MRTNITLTLLALAVGCGGTATGTDPSLPHDVDRDGYSTLVDCDDRDAAIHPDATEVCGDGVDQDCDGADASCLADACVNATRLWFEDFEAGDYSRWTGGSYCDGCPFTCAATALSTAQAHGPAHSQRSEVTCSTGITPHNANGGLQFNGDAVLPTYTNTGAGIDAPNGLVITWWTNLDSDTVFQDGSILTLFTAEDTCDWSTQVFTVGLEDASGDIDAAGFDTRQDVAGSPSLPRHEWVRLTIYLNYHTGVFHIWQNGEIVEHGTFSRPNNTICQWHWGIYASGDNDNIVLFEDDFEMWKLNEDWTDSTNEPYLGHGVDVCAGGVASAPVINPTTTTSSTPIDATITCPTADTIPYRTTDGGTPTTASTQSNTATFTSSGTLNAICAGGGYTGSAVSSATYTITGGGAPVILWTDSIQGCAGKWGFDYLMTEHPISTAVTASDANGVNLSCVLDPLGGGGDAIRFFATFDTGGSRSEADILSFRNAAFDAQAKSPEGIWLAQEWYFPVAVSTGGDTLPWINLMDWHSTDSGGGNRWHTDPGLMLREDGSMQVQFVFGGTAGTFNTNSEYSTIGLPVGEWFDIEMHYAWTTTNTATLSLWIDGVLALEKTGARTAAASHTVVEATMKFYGSTQGGTPWSPTPTVKYMRNVRFAGERIWR